MPANLTWWAWLLIAVGCWFFQMIMSIRTDDGSKGAWLIRIAFIAGMVLSFMIGVIRFVKWVGWGDRQWPHRVDKTSNQSLIFHTMRANRNSGLEVNLE